MRFNCNNRLYRFMFGCVFSILVSSTTVLVAHADINDASVHLHNGVQTASNALMSEFDGGIENDEYEEDLETFDESILVPYLEHLGGLVADIHAEIVPSEIPDQGQYSVMSIDDYEISAFALDPEFGIDRNVIIYEGTWGDTSYRAVFPAEYEQYLIVTDEGYLYNLSGSAVTGRLFAGDVNYEEYEYDSLILNSVLGNVASTIYQYGYPSYVRSYYLNNTNNQYRISSRDTYGLFKVDNIVRTDSADPNRVNGNYILILMLIGGMQLLCFMKKSQH